MWTIREGICSCSEMKKCTTVDTYNIGFWPNTAVRIKVAFNTSIHKNDRERKTRCRCRCRWCSFNSIIDWHPRMLLGIKPHIENKIEKFRRNRLINKWYNFATFLKVQGINGRWFNCCQTDKDKFMERRSKTLLGIY